MRVGYRVQFEEWDLMKQYEVKGLPLPALLVELLQQGRWQHPEDEVIKRIIPFFGEPVDFLRTVERMEARIFLLLCR